MVSMSSNYYVDSLEPQNPVTRTRTVKLHAGSTADLDQ